MLGLGEAAEGGGVARARALPAARSRRCFAKASDADDQSAAKPPAQPPPPSPSRLLGRRGRERGGGGGGARRAAREGEGKASAGRRLPRAVPRVVPAPTSGPHLRPRVVSMRVGVDARRARGLLCLPPRPPFPPLRSMPSRAGWCAGLAPSTHLETHVWRDWTSGATLCPRAGQAVGLTRRAASAPRDAVPRLPSRRPLDHRVYPLPSHFRGSRGHVHTPRLRETSLLDHGGQS